MIRARHPRWRGAIAASLVLVSLGLIVEHPVLFVAAIIPLAFVGIDSATTIPDPAALTVSRTIEPQTTVPPGRPVTVTLTVENEGDSVIPDVRVADGVPENLAVVDGTPRGGGTLRPGQRLRVRYLLVARRGDHDFADPQVRIRGFLPAGTTTQRPESAGDTTLSCRLDADAPPLDSSGDDRVGQITADEPGSGVSFHSVRDHHHEDPATRIDWRHYAKRGELATVNYERQVSTTVILVIDARRVNHVVAGPGRPTAVELAAYAATRSATDLLRHGHDIGVAILGRDGPGPAGLHWLEPGSGRDQRTRAVDLFGVATGTGADESAGSVRPMRLVSRTHPAAQVRKILSLAPVGSQLALFSPVLDDGPCSMAETWLAAGHPVVVCSPDVIPTATVSGQFEQIRRRTRLARVQSAGVRTVDWRRGTPLQLVIEKAFAADARLASEATAGVRSGGGG